ncbi:hypothetical protein [Pseudomonas promysalinigenes]|uniref:Thioredoxin domain-containing protein n=1 Tax=Pseudomonas promysalinigenes TaxID=485898 RepID=A0ABY6AIK9_9PSED|nr:hypothetical protein [Pseudomonas promysalinigenes]UXH39499.1 hypothetical protein N5C08_21505 [Pseudomonas promysalinigenes]
MSVQVAGTQQDYRAAINRKGIVVVEVFREGSSASRAVTEYVEKWAVEEQKVAFLRVPLALVKDDPTTFNNVASAPTICYFKDGKCVLEVLGNYSTSNWFKDKLRDVDAQA